MRLTPLKSVMQLIELLMRRAAGLLRQECTWEDFLGEGSIAGLLFGRLALITLLQGSSCGPCVLPADTVDELSADCNADPICMHCRLLVWSCIAS